MLYRIGGTLGGYALLVMGLLSCPAGAEEHPVPVPVQVALVQRQAIPEMLELPGTVEARRGALLSAEVDGLVEEMLVDEGSRVAAGDLLLRLRQKPKALELAARQADLERAKARLLLADLREKRNAELQRAQMVPTETHDIAAADLRQAKAEVASAQAQAAFVADELHRHEIRAPFAGIVGEKRTESGSWVRPGDVVLTLYETAVVRIRFALPQIHYGGVEVGNPVQVRINASPEETLTAPVTQKVGVGSAAARTFPVLIDVENPAYRMAPGMSVSVSIDTARILDQAALSVPADSVVLRPDGSELVWRVSGADGARTAQPVVVTTGRRYQGMVELSAAGDLSADEPIVVRGNEGLRPGQPVTVIADD